MADFPVCLDLQEVTPMYPVRAQERARSEMREMVIMSRMDQIDAGVVVGNEAEEDADIALWNKMGRAAMFFCIWSAMVIPVLLIISVR
jgi:hypothetical protein